MTENGQQPRDAGPANGFRFTAIRPLRLDRLPPCRANCPSGTRVRDWIAAIAQPHAGQTEDEACEHAWQILVEHNPFPAIMGRICPHPCEADCNRRDKDGAVAINALERFLGDWAIARGLALPLPFRDPLPEHIGVIGAGPAGLAFAYQMRRRGYAVTVYDRHEQPGGMLRYGIPAYRLPRTVLDHEIGRVLDTGIQLISNVQVGIDISLQGLQQRHALLFLGLGAQLGRRLGLSGEEHGGVWTGTGFLERHNRGERPQLGEHVVVVGGGNTAIDAARVARRYGARVTLLYRRSREDMPAIAEEVQAAIEEGVALETHAAPVALLRDEGGILTGLQVRRMQPGSLDASGRAAPVPVAGEARTILASAVITAIAQEPDWAGLEGLAPGGSWLPFDGATGSHLSGAGDVTGLDLASHAIGQARLVAERAHAGLRGLKAPQAQLPPATPAITRPDHYADSERVATARRSAPERLASPQMESSDTMGVEEFRHEIARCFSCGLCNGCQQCWMYCGAHHFTQLDETGPGKYFAFVLDACEGCGKCIELCPTGFIANGG